MFAHSMPRPECIDACSQTCGLMEEALQAYMTKDGKAAAARGHELRDVI